MGLKRRQRVEPEFSLAAMIDVIFLLLMFFMLTSKFVTPNALNLQLPSSSSTTMASPALAVSIDQNGNFYLDDKKTPEASLEKALLAKIGATGKTPETTTITVVAERSVPIEDVVFILDIANKLKLKTILATDPKPTEE
ncbi:MAG: biopolymer transporter ExbD [Saprospiraceae bacterium]|nr:biopolymer transporter ExbD [Saprospiraceae bacterium]